MTSHTDEFDRTFERLNARATELSARAIAAIGAAETAAEGAICARLVLGSQILLRSLGDVPTMLAISKKDGEAAQTAPAADVEAKPKKGLSLQEALDLKDRILRVWNAVSYFGPDAVRRAMPEYFQHLVPEVERVLDAAEAALNKQAIAAEPAGKLSLSTLKHRSDFAGRLVHTYVKKSRGGRRGRLTLAIALLDDANQLATTCGVTVAPFTHSDESGGFGKLRRNPLDAALESVNAEVMAGPVLQAAVSVLLPIAERLFETARKTTPEVDNPDRIALAE